MLNQILAKRHSIMFKWLLSYILVLFVPIMISAITYIQTARVVEHEIHSSNVLLLRKTQQQMDNLLIDARRLCQQIAIDPKISELLKEKTRRSISHYQTYLTMRDLAKYTILNNSIENFYIYYKNLNLVVSPISCNDSKSFYETYFSNSETPYAQWLKRLSNNYKGEFFIPANYTSGRAVKEITYIQTIPLLYQGNNTANIVISLNDSWFREDANDIQTINKGTILILDKTNRIIASSQPIPVQQIKYDQLDAENGLFHQKLNKKKVVISYITSDVSDLKYFVIFPNSIFWEKADYVRKFTYASLFICLLIGGLITWVMIKKNYNPIEKLIKTLEKHLGPNLDRQNNEYSIIENALDKAYAELEKVDQTIMQQNKALRAQFISRLLKGKESEESGLEERLALYEINFNSDYFGVMSFYIEDFYEPAAGVHLQNELKLQETFKKIQSVITGKVSELFGDDQVFITDEDDLLVCLINMDEQRLSQAKATIARVAENIRQTMGESYNINVIVSASKIHKHIAEIPEAYREALQALETKKLLGLEELTHYEDIIALPAGNYYYPLDKEQQLINSIKVGDFTKSKTILEEIFQHNFKESVLPVKVARCLMFNLVSTMIKTINEMGGSDHQDFLEELNPIEKLFQCESVAQMKQEMEKILSLFCNYLLQKNKEKSKNRLNGAERRLVEDVTAFVAANYQDVNMAISSIAEHFKIHPVSLSRIFREITGEGLLDYINRERLKKAKELFRQEADNLDDVANAVGYCSTRTFTRAFKKYEGITPGKYKEAGV